VGTTNERPFALALCALCAVVGCATGGDAAGGMGDDSSDWGPDAGPSNDAAIEASMRLDGGASSPDASGGGDSASGPDAAADSSQPVDSGSIDGAAVDASGNDASTADAGPPSSPIGKWNFDEGTGTTSADLSGQGHTATLVGGASWTTAGKEGAGLALDGVTGYADVGVSLIDTAQSFTVLSWAKLAVVDSWEVVASQDDVTGSLFGLKLRGDATNAFDFDVETTDVTNPGFIVAQSSVTAVAQTWVHLAGVYDSSGAGTLTVYVNGVLQETAAIGQSVMASTGHFVVGRGLYNGVTGSFVNGTLDEVEVHASALTSAQVAAVYAAEE
jgi:Concanavalin A-like lectin/glucanases superfamily